MLSRKQLLWCVLAGLLLGFSYVGYDVVARSGVVNPATTPGGRDSIRKAMLEELKAALIKYRDDHNGRLPVTIPKGDSEICASHGDPCKPDKLVDLNFLVNENYINSMPMEPLGTTTRFGTGFLIGLRADGSIRLSAPKAERTVVIMY